MTTTQTMSPTQIARRAARPGHPTAHSEPDAIRRISIELDLVGPIEATICGDPALENTGNAFLAPLGRLGGIRVA